MKCMAINGFCISTLPEGYHKNRHMVHYAMINDSFHLSASVFGAKVTPLDHREYQKFHRIRAWCSRPRRL